MEHKYPERQRGGYGFRVAGVATRSRCHVIYNGVDPAAFAGPADRDGVREEFGLPAGCRLYLHVGRMDEAKNHLRLVSIFHAIRQEQPSAHLLLVGRGGNEREEQVRQKVAALGIQDRVILAGVRADVPRLLKAADLLLFPSLWEGLPGAVLEACAAGTPVLASDLPGVRELAAHFPRVWFKSLDEADERWAEAARDLYQVDGGEAERAAATARFATGGFTARNCAEAHCRIWEGSRR